MKRIKKLTALLLALVSLASVLCFSVSARSPEEAGYERTGYSPSAAVQYALNWANRNNSPIYQTQSSGDCANFVSQCLYYGQFAEMSSPSGDKYKVYAETSKWYHISYLIPKKNFFGKPTGEYEHQYKISTTWVRAYGDEDGEGLYQFLTGIKGMRYHICTSEDEVKDYAKVGDVILCKPNGRQPNHAIIVSSIQDGNIYFCGHTNPRKDASFYDYCIKPKSYDKFYVVSMS